MESEKQNPSSIEDFLREKEKIETSIAEKFQEYVTIMFTDIAGYTSFVETHGDIAAKSLLQKHNEIVFPIIENHKGTIIKTIGDAVMASFSETQQAVSAAIAVQKSLRQYNRDADRTRKINIRIGINAGKALRDGNDYFGDAVNIAARIEPAGSPGQIMVSTSVYDALKDNDNFFISYHGLKDAKGKSEPLELYRVFLDQTEQLAEKAREEKAKTITSFARPVTRYGLMWKVSLPVTLLIVLLFIYPGFLHRIDLGSEDVVQNYMDGFMYLRNGDFGNARLKFLNIGENDPRAQEGFAAIAYKTRMPSEADMYSEKSLQLNHAALYPRVIKGNILFDSGKFDEAKQLYNEAADLDTPIDWQKGEAFFRLGRINSFQDNPSKALEYYEKAFQYDDKNADIITAKGVLLEKMGELNKALESFQTAQKLVPNDPFVKAYQKSIQEKMVIQADKEQQEKINHLIDELITNMKENKQPELSDRWTSRPVSLFFAKTERKGTIPLREGQDEFFKMELTEKLRELQAVDVVDRELLDKLLQELKISSSSLADPSTALELGRIMSARLIGDLTFIGFEDETRVYIKLIETETSEIKISISEKFDNMAGIEPIIGKVIVQVAEKIKSAFPVRGKIDQVNKDEVLINIGSAMGLDQGMMMRVYSDDKTRRLLGAVKVISTEKDSSRGIIISRLDNITPQSLLEVSDL